MGECSYACAAVEAFVFLGKAALGNLNRGGRYSCACVHAWALRVVGWLILLAVFGMGPTLRSLHALPASSSTCGSGEPWQTPNKDKGQNE